MKKEIKQESTNKASVQWFPGHMAKARREVEEKLKLVDIVFELIDARIPESSRNPMINDVLKNKPRLVLMTKSEMADSNQNKLWEQHFKDSKHRVLRIDSISGYNVNKITNVCKEILNDKIQKDLAKGIKPRAIRCMIVGIPNVGKSTLINKLVNKKVAITGDRPGVTKAQQWVRISKDLDLLDTPGVLWPRFEDKIVGYKLALTGAVKDEVYLKEDVINYFLDFLKVNYPNCLSYYGLDIEDDFVTMLDKIGNSKRFIVNKEVDYDRVYNLILNDFRSLKLGRLTLDKLKEEANGQE